MEGAFAFGDTNLTASIIPTSLTMYAAWLGCPKGSLTIPSRYTSIADGVFSGCTELTSVTIPAGVPTIGIIIINITRR
jgi:hypothetical protein